MEDISRIFSQLKTSCYLCWREVTVPPAPVLPHLQHPAITATSLLSLHSGVPGILVVGRPGPAAASAHVTETQKHPDLSCLLAAQVPQ